MIKFRQFSNFSLECTTLLVKIVAAHGAPHVSSPRVSPVGAVRKVNTIAVS